MYIIGHKKSTVKSVTGLSIQLPRIDLTSPRLLQEKNFACPLDNRVLPTLVALTTSQLYLFTTIQAILTMHHALTTV